MTKWLPGNTEILSNKTGVVYVVANGWFLTWYNSRNVRSTRDYGLHPTLYRENCFCFKISIHVPDYLQIS